MANMNCDPLKTCRARLELCHNGFDPRTKTRHDLFENQKLINIYYDC
jgi:hypothetical protein